MNEIDDMIYGHVKDIMYDIQHELNRNPTLTEIFDTFSKLEPIYEGLFHKEIHHDEMLKRFFKNFEFLSPEAIKQLEALENEDRSILRMLGMRSEEINEEEKSWWII